MGHTKNCNKPHLIAFYVFLRADHLSQKLFSLVKRGRQRTKKKKKEKKKQEKKKEKRGRRRKARKKVDRKGEKIQRMMKGKEGEGKTKAIKTEGNRKMML